MKLSDILTCLVGSDRLIIKNTDGLMLYHGFRGLFESAALTDQISPDSKVTRIAYYSDLTAKDYEKKGYTAPIDADSAPDYKYKDLTQRIYLEITLEITPTNAPDEEGKSEDCIYM